MDTWTFIIDGVEWNTPGNTEEEAFQSTYKAIEASQTLDNVHANAQSLNDTKDPAYAKRFMDTVRGADKYEQLTGSKDGWSAVGMKKGSADWSKRVGQLDQELISSGNQTISGFISAEKQKAFNAKVDVLKKKHPGSPITQDKDGNPIVAPASHPTKLSPTLQRWQKEKQSWKAIKKEDIKFSGPALAWITQFVENRHITSLAPNAAVSKMATELLEIHPGWNQDELIKALRYSLAKPVRTEGPNYNTAEAQHAQKMNRQDLAADGGSAVSMEEFQRGAQAAQSGAIGGVLGAASNITFGLGEKEIRAWLDKHGYKVDEASYAAAKVGALPAALAAGGVEMLAGKAVKAIANTEKVAGMIARGKTALSTGKIAKGYEEFAAVGRLVDGSGLLTKTGASLYRAGQSVKSGIQALRPASEAVDELAKAKNIRQIYNGVRAINSYAMPMTRTASAFIDLKKQAFEGYQSKENPLDRNFLDNWYASEATGYLTGETAALSRGIVEHANDKDPAIRHKLQAELEAVQREAQGVIQDKRFVDTVNKGEWMQAGVMLPVYIGQLIAQSMNSQYEQIKRQIGATAVASGLGAWPARIMGGMFSGAGSVSVNYASKLSEIFQKDGIDLTDDNAVIEAMKDPVAMAKRKRDALAYGIGTGFTDGFMALLGGMAMGRLASGSKAKAIANINYVEPRSIVKFGAGIADWTGQMFGGGMSEVIGQKLQAGDIKAPVSMPDVWAEVLGEGKEPVNIAMGVYADASDPIYAINTSLRNATPEIKLETYKATAQATAANPNSSELAQRHQAVKNMMREEAKANPEITTTDNVGNAINVKIDDASLDAIEAEAKRQFDPKNMSVEDKKKFLTTVDVQLAMGAANVDTNLMSYYSRLMHGLTETERSEMGMTLNEDGTSDYQTHVQGIANDYIARRDTTANMEMRINRMSSILADDGTVTSTGVDTFDKDTSAEVLMVEAENIHQLREQALSSNSTKLFQQYDDDMSKINLALMARFQTEPTYTTAIDTYVDNAIPAFIQDQTDKAGSLNGTMTISGKEVDGVFSINDDHAFFTPDGQDVTVPIDYKNLDDFKFKAGVPVEEVVQPSAEPAQPEQPYVPVAERFVAEPKTQVESTVYTKYDDLQKQLEDMEIHTPQEPKTPKPKQSNADLYTSLTISELKDEYQRRQSLIDDIETKYLDDWDSLMTNPPKEYLDAVDFRDSVGEEIDRRELEAVKSNIDYNGPIPKAVVDQVVERIIQEAAMGTAMGRTVRKSTLERWASQFYTDATYHFYRNQTMFIDKGFNFDESLVGDIEEAKRLIDTNDNPPLADFMSDVIKQISDTINAMITTDFESYDSSTRAKQITDGKPVPAEVLANYPDLQKPVPAHTKPVETPVVAEAITAPVVEPKAQVERIVMPEEVKPVDHSKETVEERPRHRQMNPNDIEVNADVFQFKGNKTATGTTGSLSGVSMWDENMAGSISVWTDPKDGKTYVVNGHNRLAKARELGVERVWVFELQAKDAAEATLIGALQNISEGHGTAIDAAKIFRAARLENKLEEMLAKMGKSLTNQVAKDGIGLSWLAPSLLRQVENGALPQTKLALIGSIVHDENKQMQIVNALGGEKGLEKYTVDTIVPIVNGLMETTSMKKSTSDPNLGFGDAFEDSDWGAAFDDSMQNKANIFGKIYAEMKRQLSTLNYTSKESRADVVAEAGGYIDIAQSKTTSVELQKQLDMFEIYGLRSEFSDIMNRIMEDYQNAKPSEKANILERGQREVQQRASELYESQFGGKGNSDVSGASEMGAGLFDEAPAVAPAQETPQVDDAQDSDITERDISDILETIDQADTGFAKYRKRLANTPEGLTKAGDELSESSQDARDEAEQELGDIITMINNTMTDYGVDIELELDTDYGYVDITDESGVVFKQLTSYKQIKDSIKSLLDGLVSNNSVNITPVVEPKAQVEQLVNASDAKPEELGLPIKPDAPLVNNAMATEEPSVTEPLVAPEGAIDDGDVELFKHHGLDLDKVQHDTFESPDIEVVPNGADAVNYSWFYSNYADMHTAVEQSHAQYVADVNELRAIGRKKSPRAEELIQNITKYVNDVARIKAMSSEVDKAVHATVLYAVANAESVKEDAVLNGALNNEEADAIVRQLEDLYQGRAIFTTDSSAFGARIMMDGKPIPIEMFGKGSPDIEYGSKSLLRTVIDTTAALLDINQLDTNINTQGVQYLSPAALVRLWADTFGLFVHTSPDGQKAHVLGVAGLMNRSIEISSPKDLQTLIHEIGHHTLTGVELNIIDQFLSGWTGGRFTLPNAPQNVQDPLSFITWATGQQITKDVKANQANGVAELFRMFTINPDALQVSYPEIYDRFNSLISPELRQAATDMRKQLVVLASTSADIRATDNIANTDDVGKADYANVIKHFVGLSSKLAGAGITMNPSDIAVWAFVDQWQPAMKALRAGLNGKLKTPQQIQQEMDRFEAYIGQYLGAGGKTEYALTGGGLETESGRKVSLEHILGFLGDGTDAGFFKDKEVFLRYIIAKSHIEDTHNVYDTVEAVFQNITKQWATANGQQYAPFDMIDPANVDAFISELAGLTEIQAARHGYDTLLKYANNPLNIAYTAPAFKAQQQQIQKVIDSLYKKARNTGVGTNNTPQDVSFTLNVKNAEEVDNDPAMARFVGAAKEYNDLSRAVIYSYYKSGLIDLPTYTKMSRERQNYADFHRVDDEIQARNPALPTSLQTAVTRVENALIKISPNKDRGNSDKMFRDPLKSLTEQVERCIKKGALNQINATFSEVFLNDGVHGAEFSSVVGASRGATGKPTSSIATQIQPPKNADPASLAAHRIFSYMRDGKAIYIQINDDLVYKSLTQMSDSSSIRQLNAIVGFYRTMIVTSPTFIIRNAIRDRIGIMRKSKYIGFKDWPKLWATLFEPVFHPARNEITDKANAAGFGGSQFAVRKYMKFLDIQQQVREDIELGKAGFWQKAHIIARNELSFKAPKRGKDLAPAQIPFVTSAWKWLGRMAERSELAPKVLEYELALKSHQASETQRVNEQIALLGLDRTNPKDADKIKLIEMREHAMTDALASQDARNLQDFGRIGAHMATLNGLFGPFLSGKVSGTVSDFRSTKSRPLKALTIQFMMTALNATASNWWNEDEARRAQYNAFTDIIKDTFLLIPGDMISIVSGGRYNVGKWDEVMSIPLGFTDAVMASFGRRLVESVYEANDKNKLGQKTSWDKELAPKIGPWLKEMLQQDLPVTQDNIAGPLGAVISLVANYDFYLKKRIVPESEIDLGTWVNYDLVKNYPVRKMYNASRIGMAIAKALPGKTIDPRQVDFFIRDVFGTVGRDFLRLGDIGYSADADMHQFEEQLSAMSIDKGQGKQEVIMPGSALKKETPRSFALKSSGLVIKQSSYYDAGVTKLLIEAKKYKKISAIETRPVMQALDYAANAKTRTEFAKYITIAKTYATLIRDNAKRMPTMPKFPTQ